MSSHRFTLLEYRHVADTHPADDMCCFTYLLESLLRFRYAKTLTSALPMFLDDPLYHV